MSGHWKLKHDKMINKIGIIGTGKFGSLLVKILPSVFPEAEIVAFSRKSLSEVSSCDLVIPAVPTAHFAEVIEKIAPLLKNHATVMDVCSVKSYPVSVMQKSLRSDTQIIASHPMFGPGTVAKLNGNVKGLRIVMEQVRSDLGTYEGIQNSFRRTGFDVVEMNSEEHDRFAAEFHFTAHVVATLIKKSKLSRTPIDTRSVESLFDFVEMVQTDDTKLLQEMYIYNPFCKKQFQKISKAYQSISSLLQS